MNESPLEKRKEKTHNKSEPKKITSEKKKVSSLEVNVLNYVQMVAQTGRWKIVLQILHDKANWPRIFQGLEWK